MMKNEVTDVKNPLAPFFFLRFLKDDIIAYKEQRDIEFAKNQLALKGIIPDNPEYSSKFQDEYQKAKAQSDAVWGFALGQGLGGLVAVVNKLKVFKYVAEAVTGPSNAEKIYSPIQTNRDIITSPVQLRRTCEIDGNKIEMQSGHAYNRSHLGGTVQDIGTMDEVENAVLKDFTNKLKNNEINPQHSGTVDIEVNGKQLSYRAVWVEKLKLFSINYFPKK